MDHLHQIPNVGKTDEPMMEGWTTISSLIGVTKTIRLGTLVTVNIYRNPALLAKMGATVDVLSGGRLIMGIGACWYEDEARAYGIPYYDVPERLRRLGEALRIIKGMWTNYSFSFDGRYYKVSNALCVPKPVQKPHPPIMIGGSGEKSTLRFVARHGDACNHFGGAETVRHKLEVLREHCRAVGRDYDEILKTKLGRLVIVKDKEEARAMMKGDNYTPDLLRNYVIFGTPDRVKEQIDELGKAGVQYLILNVHPRKEETMVKLFADEVLGSYS
jgi:F420-dependent oxidoreductase-like protein